MKPIRIALTKGRLEEQSVDLFERLGYDCSIVRNKGRKLILPIPGTNLEVVQTLCAILQEEVPSQTSYADLIRFVTDRPGHDFRYAIDCQKLEQELGWKPVHSFASGLRETVHWYLEHGEWVEHVRSGTYRDWIARNYRDRV